MAFRRRSGVLGLPHALQFLDSNLPPDSIHFGRNGLGARSAICIGVLVMGTEHLPRNKERRPAEPSLRVDENTDCVVSLPEENDAPSLGGDGCEGFWFSYRTSSAETSFTQGKRRRTAPICGSVRAAK